jgi:hypothetical protein
MARMLTYRRARVLTAAIVTLAALTLVVGSAQAVGLKPGAHGRANIVDPAGPTSTPPQITLGGGVGAGGVTAGLAGLALVLGLVGAAGWAGWQRGGAEDVTRRLAAVRAAPADPEAREERPGGRKAA